MKTAGIICEYNPFHNGHLYHINKTKETADAVLCVMSGNFVQRGGPAYCDKFSRATAAVACGADLVIELPEVFASRSAEYFAQGAVELLDKTGIIDYLSFGCESTDLTVIDETEDFKTSLEAYLSDGLSYPVAKSMAAKDVFGIVLSDKPNDILASEYLKALKKLNSKIIPLPVKREFQEYHSMTPSGIYASAGFIRKNPETAEKYMPEAAYKIIKDSAVADFSLYEIIILAHLRTISPESLSKTADCTEGLENRIIKCAVNAQNYEELINSIKTKRYTRTRIERIIANSLLGIENKRYCPEYLRILAMNSTGKKLIKSIKENSSLPVIVNLSKQKIQSEQLEIDIKAGNLFSVMTSTKSGGNDFTVSPRVI